MLSFPDRVLEGIQKLRDRYSGKKHTVAANFPIIEIIKYMDDREISTKLFFFVDSNTVEIQAPDQRFYSKISYYDFRSTERRWVRNKGYLFALVHDLKLCGLWEYVSNKDFLVVNSFNPRANQDELLKLLDEIRR
jgi:hypothetical protein